MVERKQKVSAGEVWPVMVLAHNEERFIVDCLESLTQAEPGNSHRLKVFVMANGCTDDTEAVVRRYAVDHPEVALVSIEMADKNNAWNLFVHKVVPKRCPGCEVYFFMDGDATVAPGSLAAMAAALKVHEQAHAASAVPLSGRSRKQDAAEILGERGLVANLYALRGALVKRIEESDMRLPIGLEGDDGLLGALIKWDLDPRGEWNHERIVPCGNAGFRFRSMDWRRPAEWPVYWRRLVRYARRRYEFELLGPRLKAQGLAGLPSDISEIYADAGNCRFRWQGFRTLPAYVALRQMKAVAKKRIG